MDTLVDVTVAIKIPEVEIGRVGGKQSNSRCTRVLTLVAGIISAWESET